jgi:hypothetical protein
MVEIRGVVNEMKFFRLTFSTNGVSKLHNCIGASPFINWDLLLLSLSPS